VKERDAARQDEDRMHMQLFRAKRHAKGLYKAARRYRDEARKAYGKGRGDQLHAEHDMGTA
jgi:hypothetical protein